MMDIRELIESEKSVEDIASELYEANINEANDVLDDAVDSFIDGYLVDKYGEDYPVLETQRTRNGMLVKDIPLKDRIKATKHFEKAGLTVIKKGSALLIKA